MADESTISNDTMGIEAVAVVSEEDLLQALEDAQKELERREQEKREILENLGSSIVKKYTDRRARRGVKEREWLLASRLELGTLSSNDRSTLSPDRPFERSRDQLRPGRNIVRTRCQIALSELVSSQFAGGEKNWDYLPDTTNPEAPEDITSRCEGMEFSVAQQLEDCCYEHESIKSLAQLTSLGTGVMKGPCNYSKMVKTYQQEVASDGSTVWIPRLTPEQAPELKHVSIWMTYPDDSVPVFNDSPDMIEVHPMSILELAELRKNPGFFPSIIDEAIELGPNPLSTDNYSDFSSVTDSNPTVFKDKFTVLEYHGPITKTQLDKLDIDPGYPVPGDTYFGEVWVVHGKVIRLELSTLEGETHPPYSADVWVADPASPFGFGVPILLKDAQRIVTETQHMILDNASASSAPQIVINQDMIEPADGEYELNPGKVWYFNEISGDVNKAFQQFQIQNVTAQLFPILDMALQASEEESGIALMSAGLQSPQVGTDSATQQAIIENSSTVLLDQKSAEWDKNVVKPRLRAMYDWNMQYGKDDSIKSPMKVRIRAATDYRNKQLYIRDMEKISVESAQNPALQERINIDELTRARLAMMTIPSRAIVKSDEQVQAERDEKAQNPPPPPPEVLKLEIDKARLELETKRLQLEEMKIQMEGTIQQQREQWENEERLANTYARVAEAEAQVVKSQNEKEMRLLELASRTENEAERTRLTAGIQMRNDETKRFLAGLQHTAKVREQLLTQEELKIKREKGSGI